MRTARRHRLVGLHAKAAVTEQVLQRELKAMDMGLVGVGRRRDVPDDQRVARLPEEWARCPGLSVCICAKMVCADTALPAAVNSAIALLASAPALGSVMPNSGPWVVVCGQEVGHMLGEPIGCQVAVLARSTTRRRDRSCSTRRAAGRGCLRWRCVSPASAIGHGSGADHLGQIGTGDGLAVGSAQQSHPAAPADSGPGSAGTRHRSS